MCWHAGGWIDVKGIKVLRYELAPGAMASCSSVSFLDPYQRCIYPDMYIGSWNVSLTYASPTIITLPHFYKVPLSPCFRLRRDSNVFLKGGLRDKYII